MKNYALDSNIVSYYLKDYGTIKDRVNLTVITNNVIIPPIVFYEITRNLVYYHAAVKLRLFEELYQINGIDTITQKTFEISRDIYIQLRKNGITIDDADILIAAYCIQNDYILVTNNTKHFENIDGLTIENWLE